eukprot:gene5019-biopygen4983
MLLSSLFGAKEFAEQQAEAQAFELHEDKIPVVFFPVGHTVPAGVYRNLCNRHTMLQLRVEQEADPGRHSVSAPQLEFMENKIHNTQAGTVRSDVSGRWVLPKCKMETLKELRRLARKNEYTFLFNLKDEYHMISIHSACQEVMQCHLRADLMQCSALPFGWNDFSRIFVKVMRVLVECIRAPEASRDRPALLLVKVMRVLVECIRACAFATTTAEPAQPKELALGDWWRAKNWLEAERRQDCLSGKDINDVVNPNFLVILRAEDDGCVAGVASLWVAWPSL